MGNPVRIERYGMMVWEDSEFDPMRRENCLCMRCAKMKPRKEGHCSIAQSFYLICKDHGNAFILTRCDSWEQKA